jgi:ribosomal protein S18 acetylase RimI-like enzyme
VSVRRLTVADATAYRALALEGYALHPEAFTSSVSERAALPLAWWESRLGGAAGATAAVFGAFADAQLAGVAGVTFATREKERHKADLFGVYVPAAYRQRGFGRALVAAALAHAEQARGVSVVQLTVSAGNGAAVALYEDFGFVTFGVEPMAIAVGADYVAKVHMWLRLPARDGIGADRVDAVDPTRSLRPRSQARSAATIAGPAPWTAPEAERLLRTLPQWFGIESALLRYAAAAAVLPTFIARTDGHVAGFVSLREHNADTVEIDCLAVVPERHRSGVGHALCAAAADWWRARGGRLLQVKTLGAAHPDAGYARTRAFYRALGFVAVEEFDALWPGHPCLLLVAPLVHP